MTNIVIFFYELIRKSFILITRSHFLMPTKLKHKLAEGLASVLPKRVVGWTLLRACKDYNYNKHITLYSAAQKYTLVADGKRGHK